MRQPEVKLNMILLGGKKINVGSLRRRQTGAGPLHIHLCIAGSCHLGGKTNLNVPLGTAALTLCECSL